MIASSVKRQTLSATTKKRIRRAALRSTSNPHVSEERVADEFPVDPNRRLSPLPSAPFGVLPNFSLLRFPDGISARNGKYSVNGILRYSEFRSIPSCRFLPMVDADKARSAELLNSEYSCQPALASVVEVY